MKVYKVIKFLNAIKWWFFHRFHPRHRYNIIKIGPPKYYDQDDRIELAMIICLREFVERECGGLNGLMATVDNWLREFNKSRDEYNRLINDPSSSASDVDFAKSEMNNYKVYLDSDAKVLEIYKWFIETRISKKEYSNLLYAQGHVKKAFELEEETRNIDTDMFKALMEVRSWLWT